MTELSTARPPATPGRLVVRRFFRHRLAVASVGLLVLIAAACFSYPLVARYVTHSTYSQQAPKTEKTFKPPSSAHWLGTDDLGRDELLRVLKGGQVSLLVGFAVALVATVVGVAIGGLAGYYGGWLDRSLMGLTDVFLAVPALVLMLAATKYLTIVPKGSPVAIVAILSFFFWMQLARLVRGETLALREKEFVQAAQAIGASGPRIIATHVLPNIVGTIAVNASLAVAIAILTESTLSFLGFGVDPTTPTWGNMLEGARDIIDSHPLLFWAPASMIVLTAVCVNFVGDGLRDAFDPKSLRERT